MSKIDLKGLKNFQEKLDKISRKAKNLHNLISERLGAVGLNEAEKQYAKFSTINIEVDSKDGITEILATDTKSKPTIAYHEYGTGYYAKGKYKGDLPTMNLTFVVNDREITTNGWNYYYENSDTKVTKNGKKGWYFTIGEKSIFSTGNDPQHQMYNTAKKIREELETLDLEVVLK